MPDRVWDRGLQSERTRLAWVRTAAALGAGGLGAAFLALRGGAGALAVPPFAFAALCGAVLLSRTGVRFRKVQRALHAGRPLDNRADALLAWLGVLAVIGGSLLTVACLA